MISREALENELTAQITAALKADIDKRGRASLLVSGGSTPKGLFERLSGADLDWSNVVVSLVDERYVPDGHADQNGGMVKELLLKDKASKAKFIPLVQDSEDIERNLRLSKQAVEELPRPFTVVLLGMGGDGHTASLFPESPQLDDGMDVQNERVLMITDPVTAQHRRITFTRRALLDASHLILHCYGSDKKSILDEAMELELYRPYPIQGFLHQKQAPIEIHWTE